MPRFTGFTGTAHHFSPTRRETLKVLGTATMAATAASACSSLSRESMQTEPTEFEQLKQAQENCSRFVELCDKSQLQHIIRNPQAASMLAVQGMILPIQSDKLLLEYLGTELPKVVAPDDWAFPDRVANHAEQLIDTFRMMHKIGVWTHSPRDHYRTLLRRYNQSTYDSDHLDRDLVVGLQDLELEQDIDQLLRGMGYQYLDGTLVFSHSLKDDLGGQTDNNGNILVNDSLGELNWIMYLVVAHELAHAGQLNTVPSLLARMPLTPKTAHLYELLMRAMDPTHFLKTARNSSVLFNAYDLARLVDNGHYLRSIDIARMYHYPFRRMCAYMYTEPYATPLVDLVTKELSLISIDNYSELTSLSFSENDSFKQLTPWQQELLTKLFSNKDNLKFLFRKMFGDTIVLPWSVRTESNECKCVEFPATLDQIVHSLMPLLAMTIVENVFDNELPEELVLRSCGAVYQGSMREHMPEVFSFHNYLVDFYSHIPYYISSMETSHNPSLQYFYSILKYLRDLSFGHQSLLSRVHQALENVQYQSYQNR